MLEPIYSYSAAEPIKFEETSNDFSYNKYLYTTFHSYGCHGIASYICSQYLKFSSHIAKLS